MKTILAGAFAFTLLLMGSVGCGLIDSNITTTSFVLPTQTYSFDTSMFKGLPSGTTPAVPCGAGQVVTDCCMPPARPMPDCTTTPLVCAPDASGGNANVCTAELPESVSNSINLSQVSMFPTGNISIASIAYAVSNNTLNVDLPPVTVYLAPNGVTDPKDPSAQVFGTIPAVPAGTDPTGNVQKASNADQVFQTYASNLATPFEFIASTTVVIPSGTPIPNGQVTISVTVTLSVHL
jgi:hypothetical protein